MGDLSPRQSLWRKLPILGIFVWEWQVWRKYQTQPCYRLTSLTAHPSGVSPYPIDMWPLLTSPGGPLDELGVLYTLATPICPASYHPTNIAQYALMNWNEYLATNDEKYLKPFIDQVNWLVRNEKPVANGAGGWPIPFAYPDFFAFDTWLSALTQGVSISALIRAYQLTGDNNYFEAACRAVHTFELDIREGGVSTVVGEEGVFFEEVAVYPAAHILNGYILSLFGLYDYITLTQDTHITELVQHSLATLHTLLDEYDLKYGSRYDLLLKSPTNRFYHSLHVTLLYALANYSGCEHCALLAKRWEGYQRGFKSILNYGMGRANRYQRALRLFFYRLRDTSGERHATI